MRYVIRHVIRQAGLQTDITARRQAGKRPYIHTHRQTDIYMQAGIQANIHSYRQQAGRETDMYTGRRTIRQATRQIGSHTCK